MKNIISNFENYLLNAIKISKKSIKHYRSDILHFSGWAILKIKTLGILAEEFTQVIPFLSRELLKEYKSYMLSNSVAVKTINRRLSTLRHLSRFLVLNDILHFDFMEKIPNVKKDNPEYLQEHSIQEFSKFLSSEKVSQNTSKNYIADLKQFFSWLETNNQTIKTN